jgi:hypothetical protein
VSKERVLKEIKGFLGARGERMEEWRKNGGRPGGRGHRTKKDTESDIKKTLVREQE